MTCQSVNPDTGDICQATVNDAGLHAGAHHTYMPDGTDWLAAWGNHEPAEN